MSAVDIVGRYAPQRENFAIVRIDGFAALALFRQDTRRPWTCDGQVRADIVELAPRVSI